MDKHDAIYTLEEVVQKHGSDMDHSEWVNAVDALNTIKQVLQVAYDDNILRAAIGAIRNCEPWDVRKKISAIRFARAVWGLGLKEAKDAVETIQR